MIQTSLLDWYLSDKFFNKYFSLEFKYLWYAHTLMPKSLNK